MLTLPRRIISPDPTPFVSQSYYQTTYWYHKRLDQELQNASFYTHNENFQSRRLRRMLLAFLLAAFFMTPTKQHNSLFWPTLEPQKVFYPDLFATVTNRIMRSDHFMLLRIFLYPPMLENHQHLTLVWADFSAEFLLSQQFCTL